MCAHATIIRLQRRWGEGGGAQTCSAKLHVHKAQGHKVFNGSLVRVVTVRLRVYVGVNWRRTHAHSAKAHSPQRHNLEKPPHVLSNDMCWEHPRGG